MNDIPAIKAEIVCIVVGPPGREGINGAGQVRAVMKRLTGWRRWKVKVAGDKLTGTVVLTSILENFFGRY